MATWSKCDEEVALEGTQDNKVQNVDSDAGIFTRMPNTQSYVCERKYIFWPILLSAAVILSISTVLLIFVLQNIFYGGKNEFSCSIKSQNYTAPDIRSSLNRDVDPCDNFYEFACGGWETNNPIPEGKNDLSTWGMHSKMLDAMALELLLETGDVTQNTAIKQARLLYQKCIELDHQNVDEEEHVLKFVKDTLEFYGGWPIISGEDHWNPRNFNWMKSWVALKQRFNRPVFLDINSYRDADNVFGKNIVSISKPAPNLADLEDLSIFLSSSKYIVDLSNTLLNTHDNLSINQTSLNNQASRIKEVHGNLTTIYKVEESKVAAELRKRHGFTENFGFTTLSKLQEMLNEFAISGNSINLFELLTILYEKSGVDIFDNAVIYISDISYLLSAQGYINQQDKISLANYLHFKILHTMVPWTTTKLRGLYSLGLYGFKGIKTRMGECECIAEVRTRLALVLESTLVQKHHGTAISLKRYRNEILQMFEQFKKIFLNAKSSSSTLEIDEKTNICVGFPDWTFEENGLEMEYAGLNLSQPTFLEQLLILNEWQTVKNQRMPIIPVGTNECVWSLMESGIAFSVSSKHQIYITWNMLIPLYVAIGDNNKAYNYGTMGSILAHEFSHILYRNASPYDDRIRNRTSEEDCLVKQYGNFYVSDGLVDDFYGENTLRENVADNTGLQIAYMAIKAEKMLPEISNINSIESTDLDEFSDDQKFFIGFAQNYCNKYTSKGMKFRLKYDDHSLGKFRILGTLQNSNEFAKAWNCPVGSLMNPDPRDHEKCIFISD